MSEGTHEGTVEIRSEGQVRVLTLSRPAKKNALTVAMYRALNTALDAAREDQEVRAVLLTGTSGVFTAGNDIADFMNNPTGDADDSPVMAMLHRLADFPKPLIAAIDGPAIGVGTTLLAHCDDSLASTRARFQTPFLTLGVVPEAGSSVLFPQMLGMQRASRILLCGDTLDAQAALACGLVNELVAPEELAEKALARAQLYASKPPGAMLESKRLLRDPLRAQVHEAIRTEAKLFAQRLTSEEAIEAFMAFLSKKK